MQVRGIKWLQNCYVNRCGYLHLLAGVSKTRKSTFFRIIWYMVGINFCFPEPFLRKIEQLISFFGVLCLLSLNQTRQRERIPRRQFTLSADATRFCVCNGFLPI